MTVRLLAAATLLVVACAFAPGNAVAQSSPTPGSSPPGAAAPAEPQKPARSRGKSGAAKREPTAGQMAARERQRKCAAEWKDAKAANKIQAGMKWPKYWSQCNARLKEQRA